MTKKVFIADKKLFAMFIEAIVGALFAFLFAFSISYVFKIRFTNEDGRWLLPLVAGINLVLSLIAEIAIAPRWCRWYVFRETAFECRTLFRKKQVIPYDKCYYNYAQCFYKKASGGGSTRYYIVFSTREPTKDELERINNAKPKEIYKLLYSKKTVSELESVLPANVFLQITAIDKTIDRMQRTEDGTLS